MVNVAAVISCIVLAALAIFQLALIFNAPIGKYAWGGAHTILPNKLKIGSAISICLYGIFAIIILSKAEIVHLFNQNNIVDSMIWVLALYFFIGVIMNGISRSKPERNLMTPIALALALLVTFVALS